MRAALLTLAAGLALAGCWDFQATLDAGCINGNITGCPNSTGGGAGGGAGGGGGGGPQCLAVREPPDAGACALTAPGFCRGPWCWEHPLPQGNSLTAVWLEGADVCVAGHGPTLARRRSSDGAWVDELSRLSLPTPGPFADSPAFIDVTRTGDTTWLLGTSGLLVSDGGAFTVADPGITWQAVTSRGAQVFLANSQEVRQLGGGAVSLLDSGLTSLTNVVTVPGACVAIGTVLSGGVIANCQVGESLDPFATASTPTATAVLDDGGIVVAGGFEWWDRSGASWNLHTFGMDMAPNTTVVIASGSELQFFTDNSQVWTSNATPPVYLRAPPRAETRGTMPGHHYLAGDMGYLADWDTATRTENELSGVTNANVAGFAVDERRAVAVMSNGELWVRQCNGRPWESQNLNPNLPGDARAVALGRDVIWLVGRNGQVMVVEESSPDTWTPVATGGALQWQEANRAAAAVTLTDGTVLLGVGNTLLRGGGNAGARTAEPVMTFDAGEQIVALATAGCRVGALTMVFDLPTDGGDPTYSGVRVRLANDLAGPWQDVGLTGGIHDLAGCDDGSFIAVGPRGRASTIQPTGGVTPLATTPATPTTTDYHSVACLPGGELALLTQQGTVITVRGTTATTERLPWGRRTDDTLFPHLVRANGSRLFVTGGGGAILSRPR